MKTHEIYKKIPVLHLLTYTSFENMHIVLRSAGIEPARAYAHEDLNLTP